MSGPSENDWIENRPSKGRRGLDLEELWRARELIWFMALRDVKVRFKQAVFGAAWAIVQPLTGALLFTFVFGRLADLPSDGVPFVLFSYSGFTLWTYFSTALNSARGSLLANASLVTKVYFPRLSAPIASVLPGLLDLGLALVLLAAMLAWRGHAPGPQVVLFPLVVIATVATAFGVGTLAAAVVVEFRDVQHVFGFLTQVWLFATPIGYPSSLIDEPWKWLYHLNPMVGIVEAWRWCLVAGPAPGRHAIASAISAVVSLIIGARVFQRTERRFADVI